MKSTAWRALALLSLTVLVLSMSADANAARRSALAGNQFINDADDMQALPQLMLDYKDLLIIDMAPSSGDVGNATITFGNETVWQFNTGRADFLNNTAWWSWGGTDRLALGGTVGNGLPGSGVSNGNVVEWWDIGVARELGGRPWGFNISWAADKTKVTPDGVDPVVDSSTSMLSFQLGTTLGSVQLAGELGFGSYSDKVDDQQEWSFFLVSLLARGDIQNWGGLDWRWIAAFATGSNDPNQTDAVKLSTTAFRGSFGPVWGTPGQWEVAAYMSFDYVKDEERGSDIELKDTSKYIAFPNYNMAMEYYLNSWLVARGGIRTHNSSDTFEEEIAGGGKDETKDRTFDFNWTAGVGVDKETWGIDLALDEDNMFSGYVFGNGNQFGDTIAYLSAWLRW